MKRIGILTASAAVGPDDREFVRQTRFKPGNLTQPYCSVNVDVNKRIAYLD